MGDVRMDVLKSRGEWLEARRNTIGASDAGTVLGLNPYKTNVQLWQEKTGKQEPGELSDPAMMYGTDAEELLRGLFKLDFPEYGLGYQPNNIYHNTDYPWAHASLDGWLYDHEKDRWGVLEIKTTTIRTAAQAAQWKDRIPDHYYAQVLHEMAVYEADFAVVKAQLKYQKDDELPYLRTLHYKIERENVAEEILYLMEQEKEFYQSIQSKTRPALVLPEI